MSLTWMMICLHHTMFVKEHLYLDIFKFSTLIQYIILSLLIVAYHIINLLHILIYYILPYLFSQAVD